MIQRNYQIIELQGTDIVKLDRLAVKYLEIFKIRWHVLNVYFRTIE